jgi:NAD(P)-dependent dehydrogenase (short-subunit alcohol dehydrogenase family)
MALPFVLVPVPVPRQVLIEMVTSQPTLAVITGGSRGIGLGIAKQLAIKHDILIVCRSAPSEEKVAELKSVSAERNYRVCHRTGLRRHSKGTY